MKVLWIGATLGNGMGGKPGLKARLNRCGKLLQCEGWTWLGPAEGQTSVRGED